MNRKSLMIAAVVAPLAIAAAPRTASAQPITWHIGSALAAGSGCSPANTSFLIGPPPSNQVTVLMSGMVVQLPKPGGGGGGVNSKNCLLTIPATLQQGFYIGQLTQKLTYGYTKDTGTTATITSAASFFAVPVASFSIFIPSPRATVLRKTDTITTPIGVISGCAGTLNGLYKANLAIGVTRTSPTQHIEVQTPELDVRFDILASVFTCPFP